MSLINLEQKNILTQGQNREELSFPKKISLALAAFFLSTNLVLAEPNKTIGLISFESGGTAELCVNKDGKYFIQNGNAKNGSDYIYGTVIIDGKIYIVYSDSYENDLKLFLKSDIEIYRDYYKKYGNELAYTRLKGREQYMTNFMKDNPNSNLEEASKGWEIILEKLDK